MAQLAKPPRREPGPLSSGALGAAVASPEKKRTKRSVEASAWVSPSDRSISKLAMTRRGLGRGVGRTGT